MDFYHPPRREPKHILGTQVAYLSLRGLCRLHRHRTRQGVVAWHRRPRHLGMPTDLCPYEMATTMVTVAMTRTKPSATTAGICERASPPLRGDSVDAHIRCTEAVAAAARRGSGARARRTKFRRRSPSRRPQNRVTLLPTASHCLHRNPRRRKGRNQRGYGAPRAS